MFIRATSRIKLYPTLIINVITLRVSLYTRGYVLKSGQQARENLSFAYRKIRCDITFILEVKLSSHLRGCLTNQTIFFTTHI